MIEVGEKVIEVTAMRPWRIPIPYPPRFLHETKESAWRACEKTGEKQYATTLRLDELFVARPTDSGVMGFCVPDDRPAYDEKFRVEFTVNGVPGWLIIDQEMGVRAAERLVASYHVPFVRRDQKAA